MKSLIPYKHLLKYKPVAGFDSAQLPPFHNLEYADRERLILHMINTFNADRRSFTIKRAKTATKPKQNGDKAKKVGKKAALTDTLESLSNEQLIELAKKLTKGKA